MDATKLFSKKPIILLIFAVILAGAWPAQASGPTLAVPASITLPGNGSGVSLSVTASDGSSAIPFTAAITYAAGTNQWVYANGCSQAFSGTTPANITLSLGCNAGGAAGNQTATITYTYGGGTATTTVYVGSSTATLTATGNPGGASLLQLQAPVNGNTSGTITLTSTGGGVNFTAAVMNATVGAITWLSLPQNSGSVPANGSTQIQVNANAAGLSGTPPQGTIQITYGNGQQLNVTVTFTVGGTGTLYLSQTSVPWSYSTGGSLPTAATVSVGSPNGASSYTATQTSITGGTYWLTMTANGNSITSGGLSGVPIGSTLNLAPNANMGNLSTGSYSATVQVTDSNGNSGSIVVTVSVNGGTGGTGLTITPNPVILSAAYGSSTLVSTTVSITSTISGTLTVSVVGNGLTGVTNNGSAVTAGQQFQLVVYGSASGLAQQTYTGALYATVTSGSTQVSGNVPVWFQVGTGGTGTGSSAVAPSTLQFNYEQGQTSPPAQAIQIGGSSTFTLTPTSAGNWLGLTFAAGTAPAQPYVTVNPTGLAPSTYQGAIAVQFGDGTTQQITVNLTVTSATPLLYTNPGTVLFQTPSATTNYESVILYSTDNSQIPVSVTASPSWVTLINPPSQTGSAFAVQVNTTGLPNGMSTGSVTVSYSGGTLTLPVVVYLTNGTGSGSGSGTGTSCSGTALTFGTCTISLTAPAGSSGSVNSGSQLSVTASSPTYFIMAVTYANTSTCTNQNWLSLNTYGAITPTIITATANPSGLSAGTCNATITFTVPSTGQTQSVAVVFTVGGGNVTVSPTTLNLTATAGGSTTSGQVTVSSATSGATVNFTAAAAVSTPSGGNWLSVSPTSGSTASGTLTITANPTNLTAGNYTGTVTVTPAGGTAQQVTVNLTVSSQAVSITNSSLTFNYQIGGSQPSAQSVTVNGGSFTAAASSTGNWLQVTPTSGTPGTPIAISLVTGNLTTPGTQTGTVTVTGANGSSGTQTITVTVNVTAPLPTIAAVVNAASFAPAGPISPGEVISIGGTGLGPATPVTLALDQNGNVSTSIGGVTVLIGGYPAPMIYASSTLLSVVVPYEVAGQITPSVLVKFLGQASNGFPLTAAVAVPGIFTQNASGTGPGAILNQDSSVNGPSAPAAKGSIVQVFMTGEGKTTPTAVTGKVTCSGGCSSLSQIPVPLLSVSALVGGQPAQVVFAGEAPGLVSGVMQVNLVIPATASSGAVPIVISVGTASSQSGVTVQVQ